MTPSAAEEQRRNLLAEHVRAARWFAGRGRGGEVTGWIPLPWLPGAGPSDVATPTLPTVRSELVEVRYPAETPSEWYQLLVSHRAPDDHDPRSWIGDLDDPDLGPVSVHDATADPEALALLLGALNAGAAVGDAACGVSTRSVRPVPATAPPRRFGGEQSNTSILYGDVAILKLFRRLEPGRNLDIAVHAALAGRESSEIADFHASMAAHWSTADGQRVDADLAILVEQFADARGGWDEALAACADDRDFTAPARDLGLTLARVHRLLAEEFPTATLPGDALAAAMRLRLDTAIVEVPRLDPLGPGLRRSQQALSGLDWPAQQVHGDFHLGQALRTGDGWRIIDFEGEPLRPLAERAEPDSPWRDVAGMLRSFDYAGAQVRSLRRAAATARDVAADEEPDPDHPTRAWVRDCQRAFLAGYAPEIDDTTRDALRAYEADKAVYEVVYESRHRPDWTAIPLAAVAALSADQPVTHQPVTHQPVTDPPAPDGPSEETR